MTFEEAIKLLESVKDFTNDAGKHEIAVVQKAIEEWSLLEPASIIQSDFSMPPITPEPAPVKAAVGAKKTRKPVKIKKKK